MRSKSVNIIELQNFFRVVQEISISSESNLDIQDEINSQVPRLSFLAKYLPKNAKDLALYLSAIGVLINAFSTTDIEINPSIEINPVIENNQTINIENQNVIINGEVNHFGNEKIGCNDPCWCGSGQKYKKCHGE